MNTYGQGLQVSYRLGMDFQDKVWLSPNYIDTKEGSIGVAQSLRDPPTTVGSLGSNSPTTWGSDSSCLQGNF